MSSPLVLLALVAVLYAAGIHLLLDRSLTRVLLGLLVLGNATNVLVVAAGGPTGSAPFVGRGAGAPSDALVQALVLTAIVITLGVAALLLSLIHRSWTLQREDDLTEDPEDRSVRRRLERDEQTDEDELDTTGCDEVSDTDDARDSRDGTDDSDGSDGEARGGGAGERTVRA